MPVPPRVMRRVRIRSTGSYVPAKSVENDELIAGLGTTSAWIQENLGVHSRHIASPEERSSDLAASAGARALEAAGVDASEVDMLIVATSTPDRVAPSTACIVQQKLGIRNHSPAFDVAAVCSGFIYGLTIGAQFIESGSCRRVLVIGADTFSKITDWTHRHCVFFGDGAGAVLLEQNSAGDGFFSSTLYADGQGTDCFTVPPGSATYAMNAKAVYETATDVLPKAITTLLASHELTMADVDMIIPHQPSRRVLERTGEILNAPAGVVRTNLTKNANTAGATVPLLLDEVNRAGDIAPGNLIVLAAVGAGWTWGATLYRWSS